MNRYKKGQEHHHPWLGMDEAAVSQDLHHHYHLTLGREDAGNPLRYLYQAASLTVRDRLVERWRQTRKCYSQKGRKQVAYLSMEFLMGRALTNAILNLDLEQPMREALDEFGYALEEVADHERDAGLGNGGLGRLAACFLDSCATLRYPVTGYGIRYDYGIFHQQIKDGYQIEVPDHWLEGGSPWEFTVLENSKRVKFGGYTETWEDQNGRPHVRWISDNDVLAVPHDIPIAGYRNDVVNTLRLWKADSVDSFGLADFNAGEFDVAVMAQNQAAQISMVLYPNDVSVSGKLLRLRQQYFLASASLQDILDSWCASHIDFSGFADQHCFQLNDTHPAIAVPEMMRLLMDAHGLHWREAWQITTSTMAYTNHTLLPEALEQWPVNLVGSLLPRILEIIREINRRFLNEVETRWPGDEEIKRAMAIVNEAGEPQVRMAYLAIVGSFSVNGVAALHTRLLECGLFRDFYALWPERFNNKTNGVTPRRWLVFCNPVLAKLITAYIGEGWICQLEELAQLKELVRDEDFRSRWRAVKLDNKKKVCRLVMKRCNVEFNPAMLFDVQVKRIHEYKRQLLNTLHIIHLYRKILKGETRNMVPRCVLIGGKAAPGYAIAKLIIKLVNNVADKINKDIRARPWLRVGFLPDHGVTAMETLCPGTDLSEQISTAGKEASGTGNMKFMMNGALTIGTLDGANIEIRDAVGEENFFLFGLASDAADAVRRDYHPNEIINADPEFRSVMQMLESDFFCPEMPGLFLPLAHSIRDPYDTWLTAADFRSYLQAQQQVAKTWLDQERWTTMSILNTASSGLFSSDRTIHEYARDIWHLEAC